MKDLDTKEYEALVSSATKIKTEAKLTMIQLIFANWWKIFGTAGIVALAWFMIHNGVTPKEMVTYIKELAETFKDWAIR